MMDRQSQNLMSLPKGRLIPVIPVRRDGGARRGGGGHMAGQKTENARKSQPQ